MPYIELNTEQVDKARGLANAIARQVYRQVNNYTTTTVERATLRLIGIDGVNAEGVPLPNIVVDHLGKAGLLGSGAITSVVAAMLEHNLSAQEVAQKVACGEIVLGQARRPDKKRVWSVCCDIAEKACENIKTVKLRRKQLAEKLGCGKTPYRYIIVATGNIFEDIEQAKAAVRQGADIVAVIRSTGQSLLDYVPYGSTTEGFGGTYATQENFRLMRTAMDEVGIEVGRYIQLTNYCSGLCMPEIAVMGAFEGLDMMLNDSMYGIIFRDINMKRTFIDQFFSRMVNAYAGIVINTGEDNYLTTADAYEKAYTVVASQFINEQFALLSGLVPEQIGLGHAFEINPDMEDGFLWELAHAQLVRQIFPDCPIKYMPPTKYMTGNIFKGNVQDALFNVASVMTGQHIHLLGILTEAIHTPLLHDRYLSIENASYVFNNMRNIADEIEFKKGGRIEARANEVLDRTVEMLESIKCVGLMEAIKQGMFADIKRDSEGGKGLEGVITKAPDYFNPFPEVMLRGRA